MADIRIKDLATTATTTASDDFMAVDGTTNGTRKLSAATPAFLTSVTTPSLTSPASTNLTLTSGLVGTNKVNFPDTLTASSSTAGAVTIGNGSAATNVAIGGGKVNIGDTTAGSSNAGALVLTGGLSAGNNGNASYFGGAVSGAAATFRPASDGVGLTLNQANSASAGWSFSALNTGSLAVTRVGGVAAMTCDLNGSTTFYTSGTQTFGAVVISSGNTLKLGNAYVGGAAVGTGTITIQDSTGTTYRIPVLV
jgi:hypothetical protein